MWRSIQNPVSIRHKRPASLGIIAAFAATTFISGIWAPPADAQAVIGAVIYSGDKAQDSMITLAGWGSGSATEDEHVTYDGAEVLKMVTHGLYQGARLVFATPIDLGPYVVDKNSYVQFALIPPVIAPPSSSSGYPGGSGSGSPGSLGSGSSGYPGASGSGSPGSSGSGYPGGSGSGVTPGKLKMQKPHALENLRMVFVTASGKTLEILVPMMYATAGKAGVQWRLVSVPVGAIPGLKASESMIKELRIFGDTPGTMYIGKISVVTDPSPITVEPIEDSTIQANQKKNFVATAHGGVTPLKYSWDWDARDGIQEDSTGRSIVHPFHKEGDYTVTLTVSDPYGLKAPAVTKFNLHVAP